MKFEKRLKLMTQLLDIEKQYPVEEWAVGGIQFWPVLKNHLFFHEFKEATSKRDTRGLVSKVIDKLSLRLRSYSYRNSLKLKEVTYVFSGAASHRVILNDKLINRYFDPMIDELSHQGTSTAFVEYDLIGNNDKIHSASVIRAGLLAESFRQRNKFESDWKRLLETTSFDKFANQMQSVFPTYAKNFQRKLTNSINEILAWKKLYLFLFDKMKPAYSFGLCYYSNQMYGMNLAAKERGVVAIDMQHGTISRLHPGYSFDNIPTEGYALLPNEFWLWDQSSFDYLESQFTKPVRLRHSGNPWLSKLIDSKRNETTITTDKPLVLYTHQPLKPVLDGYLLELMVKTKSHYSWWLRLHPRTPESDRMEIIDLLTKFNLLNDVNLELANKLPLPQILSSAAVHVSKYSGAVIEASLLGVPSLILEEVGVNSFQEIIASGNAIGVIDPQLSELPDQLALLANRKREHQQLLHFKTSLHELEAGQ